MGHRHTEQPKHPRVPPSIQAEVITLGIEPGDEPDLSGGPDRPLKPEVARDIAFLAMQYPED
jgi:hypothetical protein